MEEERLDRHFFPVFDGKNFPAWKFRMKVLLEEHGLEDCVATYAAEKEELCERDGDSAEIRRQKVDARERRRRDDRKCKSLLISRIHDSQLEYVRDKEFPKDIWDSLHRVFERRSIAQRLHLQRQMLSLRFDSGDLSRHFLEFDRLVREYRGTGAVCEEIDTVCYLLLTLGPSFGTVVTALETMPEENLSLEFVKCRLLDEETKRKCVSLGRGGSTVKNEDAAFYGSKHATKKKKKLKCFGCGSETHKIAECPAKKKESENSGARPKQSKAHVAAENNVCFVGASRGNGPSDVKQIEWFIDSGCSDHLVNNKKLFESLHPLKCPVEIAIAKDGESIVAKHAGTVKVWSEVDGNMQQCTVKNVLYVPDLRCNLFSVMRVDDSGMKVVYSDGKVKIYRGAELVACGSRTGKLYRLHFYSDRVGESEAMLSCGRIPKGLELWHQRFGHLGAKGLESLVRDEMVVGMNTGKGKIDKSVIVCESCVLGKQTRQPFSVREEKRSSRVLEIIHSDVCGPVTPTGVYGAKYFVTFIDDWSHFTVVYLLTSKDGVFECFQEFEALATAKFGQKISRLRCDNGGEYRGKQFARFCREKGISVEWTVPYTPEQNGVSERMNRTLVEKARSMLEASGIDKCFWGPAIQTAAYLGNRSPSNAIPPGVTPFELWNGKRPDVSNLRVFGCDVFVHVPGELRKKLDPKSWKGIFLGYAVNGYRVWNPKLKKIVHVRDVEFLESEKPNAEFEEVSTQKIVLLPRPSADVDSAESVVEDEGMDEPRDPESAIEEDSDYQEAEEHSDNDNRVERGDSERPQRQRTVPAWHSDYEMEYAAYALSAESYIEDYPKSVEDARCRSDWDKWQEAINDEMASLLKNKTWRLTKLPSGRTPITCKWVFEVKHGVDGEPDRYKARLVARGFSQRYGFDYCETYSPVAKLDTLRTVLAVANHRKMYVHQMDVATAFLNGRLSEEIYMVQPEGFVKNKDLVCRLERSIYGLKQASRAWNDRFNEFTEGCLGFKRSANDQCLYILEDGKDTVFLVLYVDDVLVIGSSLEVVVNIKRCLSEEFEMTDNGDVECFLGMYIDRDVQAGVMRISQRKYLEAMLKRFGMENCKPIATPLENRLKLCKAEEQERTKQPYRELIGCLTYAAMTTRPDLAAAVNFLSQFQSCPSDEHWAHLKRVLRYVQGTLSLGLEYRRDEEAPTLLVYSDADWANDTVDRRSVSGGILKVFGCTVSWITRKQQTVSLSSTEAELTALCKVACHEIWLARLLQDIGCVIEGAVTIFEDNQSAMRIAEESKDFGRIKHMDVKFHFLRELIKDGRIRLEYLPTTDQQADIMTKGLPGPAFRRHRANLGLAVCRG